MFPHVSINVIDNGRNRRATENDAGLGTRLGYQNIHVGNSPYRYITSYIVYRNLAVIGTCT